MFHLKGVKFTLVQLLVVLALWPEQNDCLIITSVLAGDKKFKTISFDHPWLKPLTFEKEMPNTEFRRHRTLRPPKFDIDVNIPIKLPLEDEYAQEEPRKPVESNIFFQTGEINEPSYGKKRPPAPKTSYSVPKKPSKPIVYSDQPQMAYAASTNQQQQSDTLSSRHSNEESPNGVDSGTVYRPVEVQPLYYQSAVNQQADETNARADVKAPPEAPTQQESMAQEASNTGYSQKGYATQSYQNNGEYPPPEFIPGGFVNLQLSGPTGGPKMTYADFDREKWAQQLSQIPGAMPYPILNYQQLQNFYGGLGTFTNGLAENRYTHTSILDKIKSGIHHFTNKFHIG